VVTTTVTSSLNPSLVGQNVIFTATASGGPGPGAPTGAIQFSIDLVNVGAPVTLVGGVATLDTSTLPSPLGLGTHLVIATYGGDAAFLGSASATLAQTVGLPSTTTTLTSSLNPSTFGQNVTFTATVAPVGPGASPTGTVQFTIDSVAAGAPVTLNASGVATLARSLPAGSHSVIATYSGSPTYSGSSGSLTQTVNKATTRTTVRSSDTNARNTDTVTLTATTTVVAPGAGAPTGTVEFKISNAGSTIVLNTQLIGAGGVTSYAWTTTPAQVGTWTITATYSGGANFFGSSGTQGNQRVR